MSTTATHQEHKHHAPKSIGCMVITCSDTRTPDTDTSGQAIHKMLRQFGHEVISYYLVKDEPAQITDRIKEGLANDAIQAIIINGGTGISKRDSTFEVIDAMLEKRLVGFGEIFRYLTYMDIGSPAIMSRATAGIIKGRILFSTPGSENAVRMAMEKLILPELGHLVKELSK
ncbi:MAG: MogA/MoaB family molybdenum cofactor biosynthesis protein [Nitrospiraceae bacterium]|jgi:molybdenum cofactor biosynthesis protein B|nr:MogA/MoaB family molybdenum cofactor biosynthesis protein [Nitrospira sp.]MDW7648068.1 MogA/MoaB family molybdenum cofactor biosynthesis protein [Nitrospiraceae bacterium]PHX89861.1 MAG: molybdenum cofactor biosynthesis protein [Nitrospirota bacterium]MBP0122394.1 MogA/MoaB family molybdenum cofactor biosynthesis protein [Nitrospira sp.]MBP0125212.1 MogA/MoaB family molybdenum cofactor biosynthesis protein [Nitrospira sp.]